MVHRSVAAVCLCAVVVLHVLYSPYTKVEEQWTLHATHDMLEFGVRPDALSLYDHNPNPGPVPRSYVGPLLLAAATSIYRRPLLPLLSTLYGEKLATQVIIRLVLALATALSLAFYARHLPRRIATFALILSCCQFHIAFWAGRTLPNMVAFPIVQVALVHILFRDQLVGFTMLACCASVLRGDLLPLLLSLLPLLKVGRLRARPLLASAAVFAVVLGGSIALDTYFWQGAWGDGWLWPELHSLLFNAIEGKSAEWGVSPRHHYFSHLLPRLLLLVYPFSVLALSHPPARWLAGPALSSVALLSSLGHKEWRFVVYIVPLLNTAAALFVVDRLPRRLVRPTTACILLAALSFSALSTYVSHHNYPGGHAMARLHELYDTPKLNVHIDIHSKLTGATLFTQPNPRWTYNRTEGLQDYSAFDVLVSQTRHPIFEEREVIQAYAGIDVGAIRGLRFGGDVIRFEPAVYLLQKKEMDLQ